MLRDFCAENRPALPGVRQARRRARRQRARESRRHRGPGSPQRGARPPASGPRRHARGRAPRRGGRGDAAPRRRPRAARPRAVRRVQSEEIRHRVAASPSSISARAASSLSSSATTSLPSSRYDAVLGAELPQHRSAPTAEPGLERAGLVVEAGVDDAAVVPGLVGRDAVLLVEHGDLGAREPARHLTRHGEAEDARADDTDAEPGVALGHAVLRPSSSASVGPAPIGPAPAVRDPVGHGPAYRRDDTSSPPPVDAESSWLRRRR